MSKRYAEESSKTESEETSMVPSGGVMPGEVANLFDEGFQETRAIKLGDPSNGGVGAYIGIIIGEGEPIETETPDGKPGLLPTWFAHPMDTKMKTAIKEITHVLITPAQLHVSLKRLTKLLPEGKKIAIGVSWLGKVQTRRMRQLNDFQILHKFV